MRPDIGDWSELLAAEREMDYYESLYSILYNQQVFVYFLYFLEQCSRMN